MNWENVQYIEIHIIVVNNRKLLLSGLLILGFKCIWMEEKILILALVPYNYVVV